VQRGVGAVTSSRRHRHALHRRAPRRAGDDAPFV
jgi:hypothetical protein